MQNFIKILCHLKLNDSDNFLRSFLANCYNFVPASLQPNFLGNLIFLDFFSGMSSSFDCEIIFSLEIFFFPELFSCKLIWVSNFVLIKQKRSKDDDKRENSLQINKETFLVFSREELLRRKFSREKVFILGERPCKSGNGLPLVSV